MTTPVGNPNIRPLSSADIDAVMVIQSSAYDASLLEPRSTFESILNEHPRGCWLVAIEGVAAGYLFSQPEDLASPPSLGSLHAKAAEPTCFYIHDAAVDRRFQGRGIGETLARQAIICSVDAALTTLALIAVQNSQRFWARFGFREPPQVSPAIQEKLATYGASARFMVLNRT